MAGKATSVYLSVTLRTTHKTIFQKTFLRMADLNKYIAEPDFVTKYPNTEYYITKEVY